MKYRILVDDNFHFMDDSHRYEADEFETYKEAVSACKASIDKELIDWVKKGMSADELRETWSMFGEDPWIHPTPAEGADSAQRLT